MSDNTLKTVFVFDSDLADRKIDLTEKKLFALNTDLNNLGKGVTVGKIIADDLGLAGKSVDSFKNKTADLSRPTFGGAYTEESKKINAAFESSKAAAESFKTAADASLSPTVGLPDAGKNSLLEIQKYARESASTLSPKTEIGGVDKDFDAIIKKAADARAGFEAIAKTRLDSGQVGNLTQEIVKAGTRSRQLQNDISGIKRELGSPNRKSSIALLTDELKAAEREAESLNRKLDRVNAKDAAASRVAGRKDGGGRGRGRRGGVSDGLLTGLELVDDFAPAGLNRPFNAAVKGLVSIGSLSGTALLGLGAVAAVGIGLVKISQNIREEAERRLKAEEAITGAINKQILGQREALANQTKFLADEASSRSFNRNLPTQSLSELKNRRDLLLQINQSLNATSPEIDPATKKLVFKDNPAFQRNTQEANALNAQIEQVEINRQKSAGDSFNQRSEDFKKTQQDTIESEKRFAEKRKQLAKSLISLKDDFRDSLVSFKSTDNPLVKTLSDIETATEKAQLKFGAFGSEVVKKIADIEKANLNKALNLQKFENNFAGLKFDQDARRLAVKPERSFADFARKLELVNRQVEFVSGENDLTRKISEANFFANNFNPNNPKSFAEFNRRGANDDISDAGVQIRNAVSDIQDLKNIGPEGTGLDGKEAVINKILDSIPPRDELLKRLNSPNLRGDSQSLLEEQANALRVKKDIERNKFNNFIEDQKTAEFGKVFAREQIGLINSSALTDKEKAQQRLAVTDSLGNDLDPGLKRQRIQDFVASANEKRSQEKEALQTIKDLKNLVAALVTQLTEKGIKTDAPSAQVNVTLNGVEAQVSQNQLPAAATTADTSKAYRGGTVYDDYENR